MTFFEDIERITREHCEIMGYWRDVPDMDDLLWALNGTVLWRRIAKREPSFWDLDDAEQRRSIDNHQMSEDESLDSPDHIPYSYGRRAR